jgi:GNAT superfamily N-acetyltransferase
VIGLARPEDAAGMAQVLGGWIEATPWMPKLHSQADNLWFCGHLIERCEVFVIRSPEVTGFLARQADDIPALYLAPEVRSQGLGKALLDRGKTDRDQLALWTFQANTRAIAFYLREGFAEDHRTAGDGNDEKLPDIRLIWTRKAAR